MSDAAVKDDEAIHFCCREVSSAKTEKGIIACCSVTPPFKPEWGSTTL
jgi:hypothetical protein